MPMDVGASGSYPTSMGLMYVFNLIVGTGALALPKAFQEAGYALGAALLVCSCMISYVCATFVIESMSCANAVIESRRKQQAKQAEFIRAAHRTSVDNDDGDRALAERRPLLHASPHASASASIHPSNLELASSVTDECYDIKERVELSQMAQLFLGKAGLIACYFILTVYLFGDLAIYSATVPKSFMNVLCSGGQVNNSLSHDSPCHSSWPAFFTRFTVYRIVVVVFNLLVGPLVFIGMTKTKYLQFVTTVFRWAAFLIMIGMASESLASHGPSAHPAAATFGNFGSLFGVTVYAFMCHHSLPGLITPMKDKQNVFKLLFVVFALILTFYLALSLTGSFAFAKVEDVYTLNFLNSLSTDTSHIAIVVIDYFLALFPVITISTNFPIVGITLKNNMNTLITLIADRSGQKSRSASTASLMPSETESETASATAEDTPKISRSRKLLSNVIVPLGVVVFPAIIALLTDDVTLLASVTGSYPGVGVQFVLPSLLVLAARRRTKEWLGQPVPRSHASPFASIAWPVFMFVWSLFTAGIVTVNLIQKA